MNQSRPLPNELRANAIARTRHVFVRDLEVQASVGVHAHEKLQPQRLVMSVDLTVHEGAQQLDDRLENVVCYEQVVRKIQAICKAGHVNLIETLAENIAAACLQDRRVLAVRIRIEKPDIMPECASVGVEIERLQPLSG